MKVFISTTADASDDWQADVRRQRRATSAKRQSAVASAKRNQRQERKERQRQRQAAIEAKYADNS